MPSTVTAYDVRIVPPGDAAIASFIVRDVIGEWNGLHGIKQKRVLVPLAEVDQPESASDLLVAFYCPSRATEGCHLAARINNEIDVHVAAGRPVLVYCSDAREDLHTQESSDTPQLAAFQNKYQARVTLASFGDEKEFRSLFARQLGEVVAAHPHFQPAGSAKPAALALSKLAQQLLIEACADPEAYIGRNQSPNGELKLQANGKQLVEPGQSGVWALAFEEVLANGYLRDAGLQGRLYQISAEGFAFLKTLGHSPVGYIMELGSV